MITDEIPIKLHSLMDVECHHKCKDKGLYYGDELVGAIIRVGEKWSVWRIRDYCQPLDRADLAMYEEHMEHLTDFESLHDAREYVRGPFSDMILLEYELWKGKTG